MSNKSYAYLLNAYLLNVKPSNLVFLKTYITEFDQIIIPFIDQNVRPLETEEEINSTLLIDVTFYTTKTKKYVKQYEFLLLSRKHRKNYWVQD